MDVAVLAPETVPVDLKITVWPGEEEDPETAMAEVEQAVRGLFDGRLLGNSLYLARVGSAVYATGRVRNYVITQPSADVTVTWTQLPVLRELTLVKGA